jgi:methionyl aminopeptidase
MIILKRPEEVDCISEATFRANEALKVVMSLLAAGCTRKEIDDIAGKLIQGMGASSEYKGFRKYPCNIILSINNQVDHAIDGNEVLKAGDLITLSVGTRIKEFSGIAAQSITLGPPNADSLRLLRALEQALEQATNLACEGNCIQDLSRAIESAAKQYGCGVIREFVGFGMGRSQHEEPQIPNFDDGKRGPKLKEGMVIVFYPMFTAGSNEIYIKNDGWTIVTRDGNLAAYAAQVVLVTKDRGLRIPDEWEEKRHRYIGHHSPLLLPRLSGLQEGDVDLVDRYRPLPPGSWVHNPFGNDRSRFCVKETKRGGMGLVYILKGETGGANDYYALKAPLPSGATRGSYQRFLREVRNWMLLPHHENVVTAKGAIVIQDIPHLLLEYADGGSLRDLLRAEGKLPIGKALKLAAGICRGMEHAHRNGLIHRDLKPDNVLLSGTGEAKVTDFGLIKALSSAPDLSTPATRLNEMPLPERTLTLVSTAMGTPAYMSPEQWRDSGNVGARTDIYAFGVMLYEMLCGERPFDEGGEDPGLIKVRHLEVEPPRPAEANSHIPKVMCDLIMGCLNKNPDKRPPSFAVVENQLANVPNVEPVRFSGAILTLGSAVRRLFTKH